MRSLPTVDSLRRLGRRWSRLSAAERRASLLGVVAIPAMALGARLFGVARMRERFSRIHPVQRDSRTPAASASELARATRRASLRGFYAGNCLPQSLTLLWLLRREGVEAELVLGARLIDGKLEAHAWIECDHVPINDRPDVRARFAPLESNG
jgi:hypothetical protein